MRKKQTKSKATLGAFEIHKKPTRVVLLIRLDPSYKFTITLDRSLKNSHIDVSAVHRVIQSSTIYQKEDAGEIICSRKRKHSAYRFANVSELRQFYVPVAFNVIADFYEMETINFNIIYQLRFLFAMRKRNTAFRSIFNRRFRVHALEYYSNRVEGTWQTSYRYYCPSLLTVHQLSVLSRTPSTEFPSHDHNNTQRNHRKSAVTPK
jgi:hypothetical protein